MKRAANDFSSFTTKPALVGADILLVEDSAALGVKKGSTVSGISHTSIANIGTNAHSVIDSHIASTSNPHATTSAQVGLGSVTNDSQLKRAASDFASFTTKATLVGADVLLVEDSAAAGAKKASTVGGLVITPTQAGLSAVTNDAQLKRAAADFSAFTTKATLVGADVILVEDSAASGAKKASTVSGISHTTIANIGTNAHSVIDSHLASTSNPHSTTASQVGLGSVTNDAQLKRAAYDFASFATKATLVAADVLLVEDSSALGVKKSSTVGGLVITPTQAGLSSVTNDAQLKRAASDFSTFTNKATLVGTDVILVEDSVSAGAKRYSTVGGLIITPTQAGLSALTNDAQLKRAASDFSSFTTKATLIGADVILVEDSAAAGAKKASTVGGLIITPTQAGLSAVTNDAQLKRAAYDFSSFTNKVTPIGADVILLEDSAAAGSKKYATISSLGSGTTVWVKNYLDDLFLNRNATNPAYQIDIGAGCCRSDDDTTNMNSTGSITVSMTVAGLNGLDTGAEAPSTWYYIWLIYNPSTLVYGGLISLSSTSPTMPAGYTKKRRVGVTYNNSSSNFRGWSKVTRTGRDRRYVYDEESFTNCYIMSGGVATVFTTVSCVAWVPPISVVAMLALYLESSNNSYYMSVRPLGSTIDPGHYVIYGRSNGVTTYDVRTDSGQQIQYAVSNANATGSIIANGFVDSL